jgi:hypothetical protein
VRNAVAVKHNFVHMLVMLGSVSLLQCVTRNRVALYHSAV